jgi:hypothetical protein
MAVGEEGSVASEDVLRPIRFDPQFQRLIMPFFPRQQIWTEFLFVAFPEDIRLKVAGACEALNVVPVAFKTAFKLRQGQVVRFKGQEFDSLPQTRKEWYKPALI